MSAHTVNLEQSASLKEQVVQHHQTFFSFITQTVVSLHALWATYLNCENALESHVVPTKHHLARMTEYASVMDHPALYASIVQLGKHLKQVEMAIAYAEVNNTAVQVREFTLKLDNLSHEIQRSFKNFNSVKSSQALNKLQRLNAFNLNHELSQSIAVYLKQPQDVVACYADFEGLNYNI